MRYGDEQNKPVEVQPANYTLQRPGGGRLGADFVRTLATRR